MPFNPFEQVAFDALSHAYSLGFFFSAAALLAALFTAIAIRARANDTLLEPELLDE